MTRKSEFPNFSSDIFVFIFDTMLQICENIRLARVSKGLTQQEAADLLNVKRSTYAEWERNIEPKRAMLTKIAEIFGMNISDLTGVDPGKPDLYDQTLIDVVASRVAKLEANAYGGKAEDYMKKIIEDTNLLYEQQKRG